MACLKKSQFIERGTERFCYGIGPKSSQEFTLDKNALCDEAKMLE